MYNTEIINEELIIDGIPYSKWTPVEWQKWKSNTTELLDQCDRIRDKLQFIAQNWGKYSKQL